MEAKKMNRSEMYGFEGKKVRVNWKNSERPDFVNQMRGKVEAVVDSGIMMEYSTAHGKKRLMKIAIKEINEIKEE